MAIPTRAEAFTLLGLHDPLIYERMHKGLGIPPAFSGVGTTTTMLVEASIDSLHGRSVDLVFHKATDARGAAQTCQVYAEKLGGSLGPVGAIHGLVKAQFDDVFRDHSDRVYFDHRRGPDLADDHRLPGVLGEIRSLHVQPDSTYEARDYDGQVLMHLQSEDARRLQARDPVRIELVGDGQQAQDLLATGALGSGVGTTWLAPVRLATTDSIPLGNGRSYKEIDGVETAVGDRILVWEQLDPREHGIYIVVAKGAARDTWARAPDTIIRGSATLATEGQTYANASFALAGPDNWLQIGGAASP